MNVYFRNALIISLKDGEEPFYGNLRVENNKITKIGDFKPNDGEKIIECDGNILMPGFKNAHAHTAMVFGRGTCDNVDLNNWLFNFIFPIEDNFNKDDIYNLTKAGILEAIQNGITASLDMYNDEDQVERAAYDLSYRMAIIGMPYGPASFAFKTDEFLKRQDRNGIVSFIPGFHSCYTPKKGDIEKFAEVANKYHFPIFTHMCETKIEVENCKKDHNGMTPPEYYESLGMFNYGGAGFHSIYLSDNDIEIYKKHGVYVVPNYSSNLKLNSGVCDLLKYKKAGLNIALGTDGDTSNDSCDMFKEMLLCALLNRKGDEYLDCKEIIKYATINAAKCMGLNDCLYLAEGQLADIIMLDTHMPNLNPINDIYTTLVYAGSSKNIKMTMIDGNIMYMDGKFYLKEDADSIIKKANEISKRLIALVK